MKDCIFCKIIAGELPSCKIFEDGHTYAFLDIAGDAAGHTLVIPKEHYANILDCPPDMLAHVMETVRKISRHYVENCGYDGVNILNCNGESAHQSVYHLHFHIIPRKKGDGMRWWPKEPKKEMNFDEVCRLLKIN